MLSCTFCYEFEWRQWWHPFHVPPLQLQRGQVLFKKQTVLQWFSTKYGEYEAVKLKDVFIVLKIATKTSGAIFTDGFPLKRVENVDRSYLPRPAIQWTAMQGMSSSSGFVLGSKVDSTTSLHWDMISLGGLAPSSKNISYTMVDMDFVIDEYRQIIESTLRHIKLEGIAVHA